MNTGQTSASEHRFALYLSLWIFLAIGIGIVVGSVNVKKFYDLVTDGSKTFGTVLSVDLENHNTVCYNYMASGTPYSGCDNCCSVGNPPIKSLRVGDLVKLYFVDSHPKISSLGDPRPRLHNETFFVIMSMLIFPSLIVGAIANRSRLQKPLNWKLRKRS